MNKIIQELLETNPNLINNTTIFYKKYPIDVIEENIFKLNIGNILITQDLTIDFIIKYILLDPNIMYESFANIETICYFQKNINKNDLLAAIESINEY
jgi:hypothetical protein